VIVANNLHGDYQLANGYGYDKAKMVLEVCLWALTFFGAGQILFFFMHNIP
jgi:hypothetical protein